MSTNSKQLILIKIQFSSVVAKVFIFDTYDFFIYQFPGKFISLKLHHPKLSLNENLVFGDSNSYGKLFNLAEEKEFIEFTNIEASYTQTCALSPDATKLMRVGPEYPRDNHTIEILKLTQK